MFKTLALAAVAGAASAQQMIFQFPLQYADPSSGFVYYNANIALMGDTGY